ncbi:uncharacterized protein LOC141692453 isoform X1 [Apium graveolens]|uniref:uncharacterized protein LOC141692453 isoform X1 n=1 Tax=Apium graveolens TaxID=4045 RepID=UPI003D7B8F69
MAFYKFDSLELLNDSKEEWRIRVRAQTLWKGINRQTGEIRGYNVIFCDDYGSKIHAFIAVNLVPKFEPILKEGEIYIVEMFNVKTYNGDETNRPIRNEKHIYFLNEMEMQKDVIPGLQIPAFSFDFYDLEECDCLKDDNHFLTDMIGVIEDVHPRANYNKDGEDKSHVALTITNGRTTINVTLFNQFGDSFLQQYENMKERPVIIIIACGKVSEWKNVIYITNFPATRIYLNVDHTVVSGMRLRYAKSEFYIMDMDEEDDCIEVPTMKVNELIKLNESFVL